MFSHKSVNPVRNGYVQCVFFMLISVFAANTWSQSSSEYLETISSEANKLSIDDDSQASITKPVQDRIAQSTISSDGSNQAGAIKELVPGLSVDEFEILLKNNYMGSYLFYKRLDDKEKKEIYDYYQENPDPGKLRIRILQIKKK